MSRARAILIWVSLALVLVVPVAAAATSPLLAWRDPVYIVAGFAGVMGMAFLLIQPLSAGGYLPRLAAQRDRRRLHRAVGAALVVAVVIHVACLWVTSPPDVIDALLFTSPTPFSAWGVVAMWAIFAAALLAAFRRRLRLRWQLWRLGHTALAAVTVMGSVVHAMLIEGTMETVSKAVLCALVLLATVITLAGLRVWAVRTTPRHDKTLRKPSAGPRP